VADGLKLAVVGATGAVGQEVIKVLEERNFPVKELICLGSRSSGRKINFKGESIPVEATDAAAFKRADVAILAVASELSQELAPLAKANNCIAIDNSSAFRLDDEVPLIVPEVNPEDIKEHKGIIANPNCSTIIMVVAINPIHKAAGLKRVIVSTYQAVSGAGKAGIDELREHTRAYLQGEEKEPEVFQYPIAFNLIPHIDKFVAEDYTKEEMKMVLETQKIMHLPDLKIAPTTVRVPIFRSHSESINLETEKPISPEDAKKILAASPGIIVQDNPQQNLYPMPKYTSDTDEVYVGRIRKDISIDNGLAMWVVADQIRKGAATNSIQIAEVMYKNNLY
jgi:aspartate-semialdehyde dehydrogenase